MVMLDINDYIGVVYFVLGKFSLPQDEFLDVALIALDKACRRFDPTKTKCKPQTFLIYQVEMYIADEIERKAVKDGVISKRRSRHFLWYLNNYQTLKNITPDFEAYTNEEYYRTSPKKPPYYTDDLYSEIEIDTFYQKCLTPKEIEICKLRIEGYTCEEIGKIIGCKKQNVSRYIGKIRKKMIEYFGEEMCSSRDIKRYN